MNIIALEIEDYKRLKAVEINPDTGEPVVLTGDNGQGKSSVLDAVFAAVTGNDLEDSIRHGCKRAKIKLAIGAGQEVEYFIEKVYTNGGKRLTITDAEGKPVPRMQTFLDSLTERLAFDPLAFANMSATKKGQREQAEILRQICGLDTSDLDTKRAELYTQRTTANSRAKEAQTLADNAPAPAPGTPETEQSATEIMAELDAIQKERRKIDDAEAARKQAFLANERAKQDVLAAESNVEAIRQQLAKAEHIHATAIKSAKEFADLYTLAKKSLEETIDAAPTEAAEEAVRAKLADLDKVNSEVRKGIERAKLKAEARKVQAIANDIDAKITAIDEERAARIAAAVLPIPGMEIDGDTVLLNGCVFAQLSTAEQIRISTMVAMAQNPGLKIIIIREGALINKANFSAIAEMAKEKGYQVWVEKFQEHPDSDSLHIVEGEIAFDHGKPVAKFEAPEEPAPTKKAEKQPTPAPAPSAPAVTEDFDLFPEDL